MPSGSPDFRRNVDRPSDNSTREGRIQGESESFSISAGSSDTFSVGPVPDGEVWYLTQASWTFTSPPTNANSAYVGIASRDSNGNHEAVFFVQVPETHAIPVEMPAFPGGDFMAWIYNGDPNNAVDIRGGFSWREENR